MANLNKKPGQGKTPQQYKDSSTLAWYSVICMIILLIVASLLTGCTTIKCCEEIHKPGDVSSNIKWDGLKPIFKKQ